MKTPLAILALSSALLFSAPPVLAEECGDVTIAQMNWQSADLLAQVDRIILSEGYGCNAVLVPGDTLTTFQTMNEDGMPDIAPEFWINAVRQEFDGAVDEGRLEIAAASLSDGGVEGWWIPAYLAEEHPDIKSIDDALQHPELFPAPDRPGRGAIHSCPPGWSCRISTRNLFKAHDAQVKGFDLIEAETPEGLSGSIGDAYEAGRGWLGYFWAPTATLGQYEMVRLDFGVPHDKEEWDSCTAVADCPNPQPNAWPKSSVYTVVTEPFRRQSVDAFSYLSNRSWSNRTVNGLLAWIEETGSSTDVAARHFLENNEDLWSTWVSPEAAEKTEELPGQFLIDRTGRRQSSDPRVD